MTHEYVGTKIVTAWPQEKDGKSGYAVKYSDGYTSWSPKAQFEEAYEDLGNISHLPEWHQRLIAEGTQLATKLEKLTDFLQFGDTSKTSQAQIGLLREQQVLMTSYLVVLTKRAELAKTSA